MIGGWLKGHRKRFENPLFTKPYCRGYAWDWLCAEAAIEGTKYDVGGQVITISRGQLCVSFRELADAWGWKKDAVARLVTRLKTETMITTAPATGRKRDKTIITICNYEIYQHPQAQGESAATTAPETPTATAPRQHRDTKEEGEEKKKGSASSLRSDTGDCPLSEIIFGQGLKFLCKSGVLERQARSVLGKWRKNHGDEKLLAALGKAQREGALDPVAYCEGVFRHVNGKPEPQSASDHIMAELRAQDEAKAAEARDD